MTNDNGIPVIILRLPPHVSILNLWLDIPAMGGPKINLMYEEHGRISLKEIDPNDINFTGDGKSDGSSRV